MRASLIVSALAILIAGPNVDAAENELSKSEKLEAKATDRKNVYIQHTTRKLSKESI